MSHGIHRIFRRKLVSTHHPSVSHSFTTGLLKLFFPLFSNVLFFFTNPSYPPTCLHVRLILATAQLQVWYTCISYHILREKARSVFLWNIHKTHTRLKAFTTPILTASIGNRSDLSDRPASGDEELWRYDNSTLITKLVTVAHTTCSWKTLLDSKERSSTWSIIHLYTLILRG